MGSAGEVVVLIDGAEGGWEEFWASSTSKQKNGQACVPQIVDFYHAVEHAGEVLAALIGKRASRLQKPATPVGQTTSQEQRCES